jgi:hypothetical protein
VLICLGTSDRGFSACDAEEQHPEGDVESVIDAVALGGD